MRNTIALFLLVTAAAACGTEVVLGGANDGKGGGADTSGNAGGAGTQTTTTNAPDGTGTSCFWNGETYQPGGIPAGDGCNTCECLEDGTVSCTEMWCEGLGGAGGSTSGSTAIGGWTGSSTGWTGTGGSTGGSAGWGTPLPEPLATYTYYGDGNMRVTISDQYFCNSVATECAAATNTLIFDIPTANQQAGAVLSLEDVGGGQSSQGIDGSGSCWSIASGSQGTVNIVSLPLSTADLVFSLYGTDDGPFYGTFHATSCN